MWQTRQTQGLLPEGKGRGVEQISQTEEGCRVLKKVQEGQDQPSEIN
jgi:hypothetical protein